MGVEVGESTVDLVVVWDTATTEGLDDAEEVHLYRKGKNGLSKTGVDEKQE